MNDVKVTISGLDMVEILDFISAKNKKYQAMILSDLEEVFDKNSQEFALTRKVVLDYMNRYSRSIVRLITGNIEDERT